jgi:hypothetical protein
VQQHPFNWKKASMAAGLCYGVRGGGAQDSFHITAGNYNTDSLIQVLAELRRFLGWREGHAVVGRATRPPQPRHAGLAGDPTVLLVVERLAAYAPELNPVEGLWSWQKGTQIANLVCPTLGAVVEQAEQGIEHVRQTPHLVYSFLRRTGLSVS